MSFCNNLCQYSSFGITRLFTASRRLSVFPPRVTHEWPCWRPLFQSVPENRQYRARIIAVPRHSRNGRRQTLPAWPNRGRSGHSGAAAGLHHPKGLIPPDGVQYRRRYRTSKPVDGTHPTIRAGSRTELQRYASSFPTLRPQFHRATTPEGTALQPAADPGHYRSTKPRTAALRLDILQCDPVPLRQLRWHYSAIRISGLGTVPPPIHHPTRQVGPAAFQPANRNVAIC